MSERQRSNVSEARRARGSILISRTHLVRS
jgi:hypothetical protein